MNRAAPPAIILILALLLPLPATAATGAWSPGEHVRLRLLATRPAPGAAIDAAIEIELDPGWKTYWRSPGDAGIPPRLDFSASTNAGPPAIDFPPPEREDDGVSVSNVYHDRIVLPVRLAAGDAAGPATLALGADLGVCQEICLPVTLAATLDVAAGDADPAAAEIIAAARASLPGAGRPGAFEIQSLARVGGSDADPVFEARVANDAPGEVLLFAETPQDWYPAAPAVSSKAAGSVTFRFDADRRTAAGPLAGATIRLTLTAGGKATTRAFELHADGSATPLP